MQHIIYIDPDYDFGEQSFTDFERNATRDPAAFLKAARGDDGMKVYGRLSDFVHEFNDDRISDLGYLILVDDRRTPTTISSTSPTTATLQ